MIKKVVTFLMATLLIFSLVACGNAGQKSETAFTEPENMQNTETKTNTSETEVSEETVQKYPETHDAALYFF